MRQRRHNQAVEQNAHPGFAIQPTWLIVSSLFRRDCRCHARRSPLRLGQSTVTTNEQPNNVMNLLPKHPALRWLTLIGATLVITAAVCITPYVLEDIRKSSSNRSTSTSQTSQKVDPDPTGTWIEGDQNSVYNRLVVRSSGSFSFQTVDFTGDVKGGYSGRWSMSGSSVRFEWGGIADHGSCSGYKSGPNSLVFGATTIRR